MQKVTTCLWYNMNAEEAMKYYVEVFNGNPAKKQESKLVSIDRFPDGMQGPAAGLDGKVAQGLVELEGNQVMCFDGGPEFKFSAAASLVIDCQDQTEVDYFWSKLSHVPEAEACGWCTDQFGLPWQVVPKQLAELMGGSDKEASQRVMGAMMQMKKLEVDQLQAAHDGK